jgi:hypothetical protein
MFIAGFKAHRLFESAHPVSFRVAQLRWDAARARVGASDAEGEGRNDSFPWVWGIGLRLSVAPLLLQVLSYADQLPAEYLDAH